MSIHIDQKTTHTCDVCGKECEPIRNISIPFSYFMDTVSSVRINISAYIPYGTTAGDVCKECAKKYIGKWIESL